MSEQLDKVNTNETMVEQQLAPDKKVEQFLDKAKVDHEILPLEDNVFSEVIVLQKDENPNEKMVRVYRGVNNVDENILNQTPYAMRTIVEKGGEREVKVLNDLRAEVDALANNPTYENLLKYIEKVRPCLQSNEIKWLKNDLAQVEEGVLKGRSVRSSLNFMQYAHGGGAPDVALTPYVSATTNPLEAAKYGNIVMVMDVPVSMISDFKHVRSGEISLKGVIDQKHITALIPRKPGAKPSDEKLEDGLAKSLHVLDEKKTAPLFTAKEMNSARENQLAKDLEGDKAQQQIDLQGVRQKRFEILSLKYPEANIQSSAVQLKNEDIYAKAKEMVFDHYASRLAEIVPDLGMTVEEYLEKIAAKAKEKIDRGNISEKLLETLKERVKFLEAKHKDRQRLRNLRETINNV